VYYPARGHLISRVLSECITACHDVFDIQWSIVIVCFHSDSIVETAFEMHYLHSIIVLKGDYFNNGSGVEIIVRPVYCLVMVVVAEGHWGFLEENSRFECNHVVKCSNFFHFDANLWRLNLDWFVYICGACNRTNNDSIVTKLYNTVVCLFVCIQQHWLAASSSSI
jgi:hypothetical protein